MQNLMNGLPPAVSAMANFTVYGNVVDPSWSHWLKHHCKARTCTYIFMAVLILADVLYWYKPQYVRCERTGRVTEVKKRFASDMLQRSYSAMAEQWALTKDQAKAAVKLLVDAGALRVEFRDEVRGGVRCSNVMYVEPIMETIQRWAECLPHEVTDDALTDEADVNTDLCPNPVACGLMTAPTVAELDPLTPPEPEPPPPLPAPDPPVPAKGRKRLDKARLAVAPYSSEFQDWWALYRNYAESVGSNPGTKRDAWVEWQIALYAGFTPEQIRTGTELERKYAQAIAQGKTPSFLPHGRKYLGGGAHGTAPWQDALERQSEMVDRTNAVSATQRAEAYLKALDRVSTSNAPMPNPADFGFEAHMTVEEIWSIYRNR